MDITWTNDTVPLGDLTPWERNPKRISKTHAERLLAYWRKIGQFQSIAIGPDGEVYDGHQRLSVLLAAFGKSYQVDVRRASRALTEAERQELVIAAHTGTTGQWDWDALSAWNAGDLQAWGLDEELLKDWNAGATALREMLAADGGAVEQNLIPDKDRYREQYGVIVICDDAEHQETVYNALREAGYSVRVVVT